MKFGPLRTRDAEGALLAHTIRLDDGALKKGHSLTADDIRRLQAAQIKKVITARLDPDDCHEDRAAERLARAATGGGITLAPAFTGRVNLHAATDGLLIVDTPAVNAVNRVDPAITLATLPAFERVTGGRMVATAKIIPLAVGEPPIARAEGVARAAVRVAPFRARSVGLVATTLPHLKPATLDKTRRITEARLAVSGSKLARELRVAHTVPAVAEALREQAEAGVGMILIFGASAIVDPMDVIPEGIRAAGGEVEHFGMPVDPGNLLLIGRIGNIPVIGAPGCARSPKENGFDWVLDRYMADCPVTRDDIMAMGVGGLLMEIGTRPQPREAPPEGRKRHRKIAGVLLAAGQARRAGGINKLLATIDNEPIVRIAARNALGSGLASLTVVTGHMSTEIEAALDGLPVTFVHNPDYAEGMAGSIRAGISALPSDADAALVLLADMPEVTADAIDRLIAAYAPDAGVPVVAAAHEGKRGNPVLWDKAYFEALARLEGDSGARHLLDDHPDDLALVEIGPGARLDLDTPEALAAAGARPAMRGPARD
ncbi:NTP transferase domain-containing protein [Stappia sp. ES.058]|uniref:NTP transferase domain-containing protein n=1 Tax=Stappia sp. ES.058 TaxID=1881061 RepID=UPI00087C2699|nr:molybdopterin-binding/glycosyltransferase family 2 protein [Stappia sp. ES.058]SDU47423.1 molybdopterin molybdochelatase /molybdenum cofactor cytidylyltransferase [Stappia sp. ES.058]